MFEESELYEALGLEAPASEENPEVTEPEEEQTDPEAEVSEENPEVTDPEENEDKPDEGGEKKPQSPEERRRNAAIRRKKELDEAVENARREEREAQKKLMDAFVESLGRKDPESGEVIKTMEAFQALAAKERSAQAAKDLKAGRLTQEGLQEALRSMPEIRNLIEKAQTDARSAEEEKNSAELAAFEQTVARELEEIAKLNPNVKTLNDVLKMPTGISFARYVQENGLSFLDAYKLANAEAIAAQRSAAAAQAKENSVASKKHLVGTVSRGEEVLEIPNNVMESYRMMNPGITDDEIRKHYAKFMKRNR